MYVKDCIAHDIIDELTFVTTTIECITIRLPNVLVTVVYRPPASSKYDFLATFETIISKLHLFRVPFFLMGDVNINMLSDDVATMQFETILSTYCCVNTIGLPSRITDHSATLLDVCITNVPTNRTFTGLLSLDLSDHLPVFALFSTATTYRVINQFTLEKFYSEIALTDFCERRARSRSRI